MGDEGEEVEVEGRDLGGREGGGEREKDGRWASLRGRTHGRDG